MREDDTIHVTLITTTVNCGPIGRVVVKIEIGGLMCDASSSYRPTPTRSRELSLGQAGARGGRGGGASI